MRCRRPVPRGGLLTSASMRPITPRSRSWLNAASGSSAPACGTCATGERGSWWPETPGAARPTVLTGCATTTTPAGFRPGPTGGLEARPMSPARCSRTGLRSARWSLGSSPSGSTLRWATRGWSSSTISARRETDSGTERTTVDFFGCSKPATRAGVSGSSPRPTSRRASGFEGTTSGFRTGCDRGSFCLCSTCLRTGWGGGHELLQRNRPERGGVVARAD